MFNKYKNYEDYGEYEEFNLDDSLGEEDNSYDELRDNNEVINIISILAIISNWFMRIGVVIAIILTIIFFVTGKVGTAFLYIGGLIIAFFFGYVFMYFLDKFLHQN